MRARYYILVCLSLCSFMAFATEQLVSLPVVARPDAFMMQSTSAFLSPKTAVVLGNSRASMAVQREVGGAQLMSYKPLATTSSSRKHIRPSSFGVAGGVQLPAWSITKHNLEESVSTSATNTSTPPSGPRKVGGGSNPDDPYWGEVVPVGDVPMAWMILLLAGLLGYRRYALKRQKLEK